MSQRRHAISVVDLAFGDCGKGSIVDFLTRTYSAHTVVRFNGGPQAGHNVVTGDGRHHTFSQFGSGTFVPGVKTLLSRFMLIEPYAMFNEAAHLKSLGVHDAWDRLLVDFRCLVITPAHQAANRLRELARGASAHGTSGQGVGDAMQDQISHPDLMLHAADLGSRQKVRKRLHAIRDLKVEAIRSVMASLDGVPGAQFSIQTLLDSSWIETAVENYAALAKYATIVEPSAVAGMICQPGTVIFEGAQGVLLDETFGFHPHTTWSTTTFANTETLLDEARYDGDRTRLGVLRSYFTRHGSGPFMTEHPSLRPILTEPHNSDEGWQGPFRVGHFDAVAARYAIAAAGRVDALAITYMDRLSQLPARICTRYEGVRSAWFVHEKELIKDIRVRSHAGLGEREHLSQALGRCRPEYRLLKQTTPDAFLSVVESELRLPVSITSFGPCADDKRSQADTRLHSGNCVGPRPRL